MRNTEENRLLKVIRNPSKIIIWLGRHGFTKYIIPDKLYIKLMCKQNLGYRINLKSPQTFNEKLQWLKLHDRNPDYIRMVDKYEVRAYLANLIGDKYLIPLLGKWDRFEDIDFDSLPNEFVLKCTHDSGGVFVILDKNSIDKNKLAKEINRRLKTNYFYLGREWPYKYVKPRIIAEEYMVDSNQGELIDYKMMVFNGKVKCSFTCTERFTNEGLKVTFFDRNWNRMPVERHYTSSSKIIDKPLNYEKMLEIAEKVAKNMKFLRVDFYEANGKLFIGELTLYPGNGQEEFRPEKYDAELGSWLQI